MRSWPGSTSNALQNTSACVRSGATSMRVSVTRPTRGSVTSSRNRRASSASSSPAMRSVRLVMTLDLVLVLGILSPRLLFVWQIDDLDVGRQHTREMQVFDEPTRALEHRAHGRGVHSCGGQAERRILPGVLTPDFRNGQIELVAHATHDRADH